MGRQGVGYDIVLVAHVVAGVVGFGAMAFTGVFADRARRDPHSDSAARYFRTGTNWAGRTMFLVPVLGVLLLAMGSGDEVSKAWVLAPIVLWFIAAALATSVLWPAESAIHRTLRAERPDRATIGSLCLRASWSASVVTVVYLVSFVIMIAKPGG